jgi:hypothetical protein
VQTLAIPILSSAQPPTVREPASRLTRRRQRAAAADSGCDLSLFADQVKIYLERAATHQLARADVLTADAPTVMEASVSGDRPAVTLEDTPAAIQPAPIQELPMTASGQESPAPRADIVLVEEETYEEWLPMELAVESLPAPPSPPLSPPAPETQPDPSHARALEDELGLVARPGHTQHLWRVTVGLTDETALGDEPAKADPAPVSVAATPVRRRPRAHKPSPPPDDWAYFDPTQTGFKALIRRLDEIAAQ